ncbi:MAG: hypothetical protein ACK40Q_01950, partial [Pseudothermotoga sp.]
QAVSDQHIYYDSDSETYGPQQVSVSFNPHTGNWIRIYPTEDYDTQSEPLEKFKTYEWGLDVAAAIYETDDGLWISATIDYYAGYVWNPALTNEADYFNRFTTGE